MEITVEDWIKENSLKVEFKVEKFLKLENVDKIFYVLPFRGKLFSEDLFFNLTEEELEEIEEVDEKEKLNFLFQFGDSYYYSPLKAKKNEYNEERYLIELNDFLYLGNEDSLPGWTYETALGIHSEYEILNSALNYSNAVKKAKFLGIKSLGICDRNTLGGALGFQLQCKKSGLRPIIGETVTVAYNFDPEKKNQIVHEVKLYCTCEDSWFNLLTINKIINVEYNGEFIPEERLLELAGGLVCIFDYSNSVLRDERDDKTYRKIINTYSKKFLSIYYQFSTVEYSSDTYDKACLTGFKHFLDNYYNPVSFSFVYIDDTYYLEKKHSDCKLAVNNISKKAYQHSFEQHFKTYKDIRTKIEPYFEGGKYDINTFLSEALGKSDELAKICDFEIPMEGAKLPKFEMDGEMLSSEESVEFLRIICEEGFEEKIKPKIRNKKLLKEYRKRYEKEFEVISTAGFSDYFLILWDTVNYAVNKGVMVGTGRGSVGGSLLAYLIGITRIDPIKYDLLFERFLNEARISPELYVIAKLSDGTERRYKPEQKLITERGEIKAEEIDFDDTIIEDENKFEIKEIDVKEIKRQDSLPDVDIDFCGANRDEIKAYLKNKYGDNYTCSVGTYGRLKLRQTFKDLAKIEGVPFKDANELTKKIDDQHEYEFFDLFKYAIKDEKLYKFVQKHPEMIGKLKVILNNPKSISIHPSAVLVLPKQDLEGRGRSLDNWIPIRKVDGMNVSEWEGKYCDIFGLLKNDILGLAQLDKFTYCLDLIKKNKGEEINLDEIDLDDEKTYRLFQKGLNEDVFQFGSYGLKGYSRKVLPDSIDDLIAMNALYRPGPMSSNAHEDYAKIKHGEKKPEYDYKLKEVTEATGGLYIYQEQIMKAVVVLGGFSLVKSDQLRTAIKKFDAKVMKSFEDDFINGALENGCPKDEAEKIWKKLLAFSGYGFNKSHSAAYGLIAYHSQWLKANYPLEFWTTALNFGDEKVDLPYYLSEIKEMRNTGIKIVSADINLSAGIFVSNPEENSIVWSLVKIKGVGEKAVEKIIHYRNLVGRFHSLEHFLGKVPKRDVNKKTVINLIIAGAFDRVEGVENKRERASVLFKFYEISGNDPLACEYLMNPLMEKEYFWILAQKALTGYGDLDYRKILSDSKEATEKVKNAYLDIDKFKRKKYKKPKRGERHEMVTLCGFFNDYKVLYTRKGDEYLKLNLEVNSVNIEVIAWPDEFEKNLSEAEEKKRVLVAIYAGAETDTYSSSGRNKLYLVKGSKIIKL